MSAESKRMNTEQTLMLQALKAKQMQSVGYSYSGDLIGQMIEGSEEVKAKMHNICAFITPELHGDITSMCELLDLSKRQFVEMALVDFLAKAQAIIDQVNVFEFRLKGRELVEGE